MGPAAGLEEISARWERFLDGRPATFDHRELLADVRALPREESLARLAGPKDREATPWAALAWGLLRGDGAGLAALESAERRAPARRYAWLSVFSGLAHLKRCNFADAAASFARAQDASPRDWRARFLWVEAMLCLGRRADALRAVARVDAGLPEADRAQARAWRGKLSLWVGRYAEARRELEGARAMGYGAAALEGAAAYLQGDAERGLELVDQAVRSNPTPEAFVWRGEINRALGRLDDSLADLRQGPPGAWKAINGGLTRAALGDDAGLEADFFAAPSHVTSFLRERLRLPALKVLSPAEMRRVLLKGLALARGFRSEEHDQAVWLAFGAHPQARLNEAAPAVPFL